MKVHRFMPTGIALIESGLIVLALGVAACVIRWATLAVEAM
ncbi:putative membrane protein [Burkholderia pseudomallei MSHR435]|nr:putative membrane protein [Burkholderia pseudomallei MSHR449]KGX76704.1 putative membrane protein [Burkholderia pseudomallei MSHR435]